MSQLVKTKRQANFKDFKRFGAFKGAVEQKNVVINSFFCKLGLFWHWWVFKTLVSLAFNNGPLVRKKAQFTHELIKGIIGFKIKNPPTLHPTSKIQPTTSPNFVFSVFESVRKTWGYEIKLLTVVLVVVHRVF
jgi:hypothetical protein